MAVGQPAWWRGLRRRCRPLVAAEAVRCHGGTVGPIGPTSTMGTFSHPSWHCRLLGRGPPSGAAAWWDVVLFWDTGHPALAREQELREGV